MVERMIAILAEFKEPEDEIINLKTVEQFGKPQKVFKEKCD
jgi:hypothetical protein